MLYDVITTTLTVTPVIQPTVTSLVGQAVDPGTAVAASDSMTQLAAKLVGEAATLGTFIYGGIEAIDSKVVKMPGSVKSFLSWVLSGVLPYIVYIWQAISGVTVFDFNMVLLLAGMTKASAEGLHQATDATDSMPLADAVSAWWKSRGKKKKPRRRAASSSGGNAASSGGNDNTGGK
jgi:hypothetical protein